MKSLDNFVSVVKSKPKGLLAILGGFLVHLSLGSIYTYGNMAPYIIKYMQNNTSKDVNAGNSIWIFGLSVFGLGASMSLGGFIDAKIGSVYTVLLGGWIMSFGVIITFFTIKVHLVLIALSYGLIAGIGTGIAYGVALGVPSEWFPNRRGLVSGIIVAGFGLGALVFDFIQSAISNTDFSTVNLTDVSRVPLTFLIMGIIYAVLQLIGGVLIRRPEKKKESVTVDGSNETETDFQIEDVNSDIFFGRYDSNDDPNVSPFNIIYEWDFWVLWLTFALNSVVLVLVLSLHKLFGNALNINDLRLIIVSALGSFFNGFGRIIWGYLNDRISYKVLMSILTFCMSLMFSTFYLGSKIGDLTVVNDDVRYAFYFVWVVMLHFLLSGNFSLFPSICLKTFGVKYFANNYGLLFTAYSFGGVLTSIVTTKLLVADAKGMNQVQSFLIPFLIGSGLSLLAGLLTLMYRGRLLFYRRPAALTL